MEQTPQLNAHKKNEYQPMHTSCSFYILIITMLLLLCSCDGWYSYEYTIKNDTNDTLKVVVENLPLYYSAPDSIYDADTKDSVYIINPQSSITIEQDGSLCGWSYKPIDLRDLNEEERIYEGDVLLLDYITKVYAGNNLIDETYWDKSRWNFKSKTRLGIYSITIKSHMISK